MDVGSIGGQISDYGRVQSSDLIWSSQKGAFDRCAVGQRWKCHKSPQCRLPLPAPRWFLSISPVQKYSSSTAAGKTPAWLRCFSVNQQKIAGKKCSVAMLCPPMTGQKCSRRFPTRNVASDQQFLIFHGHFLTKLYVPVRDVAKHPGV